MSVIIPLVLILAAAAIGFGAYRRYIKNLKPDDTVRQVNGARLTSETLRKLSSPPWRVAYEISEDRLGGVDHVIIGPAGVIAVATYMIDRPARPADTAQHADAQQLATAAMMRSGADDLARRAGLTCDLLAKIYWGSPQPDTPAAFETMHQTVAVEGQRLDQWLQTLPPGPLTASQVDLAWQAVLTGIGRPDPLA